MKSKVLIIIPAYNESENIETVVDHIVNNYPQYDYVVINDGSKDKTREVCRKRGYQFINLSINLGIGGAVQTGYKYARDKGYDMAVQLDGDGQHDVTFLDGMIKIIENQEADIVIGSRFVEKEGFQSSFARRTGINFLSFLILLSTGKHIKDVTSGYRLVNKRFIEIYADDYPIDYPEPEAIICIFLCDEIALPEIWKSDVREVEIILCEFTLVMLCLSHIPHAWICRAQHQYL